MDPVVQGRQGGGDKALAFVIAGLFALVILLPATQLLDLKRAAGLGSATAACLGLAWKAWQGQAVDGPRLTQALLKAWRWAALAVALYALLQRLGLEPLRAYALAGSERRAMGTFGNAGYLAAFLCLSWPLHLGWQGRRRNAALLLMLAALLATQSRAGVVALSVQLGAWAWQAWRQGWRPGRRSWLALALGLGLLAWLFPPLQWWRPTQRWPLWQASWDLWLQKPWLGWGWEGYASAIQAQLSPALGEFFARSRQYAEDPHQLLLAVACRQGLLGLGGLVAALWAYARLALRSPAPELGFFWLGALGLLVESQFDRFFFQAGVLVPLLASALLLALAQRPAFRPRPRAWALAGLLAAGWLAWAGARPLLDYQRAVGALDQGVESLAPEESVEELESLAAAEPNAEHWERLGAAWASRRRYRDAAGAYQAAYALEASRGRAQNMGNCMMMLDQADQAVFWFRKAVSLDPKSADAHFSLGYALFHQNKVKEALAELDQALRLDPGHANAAKLKEQILP